MAHILQDNRTGNWFVGFRYGSREFRRSCRTDKQHIAKRIQATVEDTIDLLDTGRLSVPENVDIGLWILSGGKAAKNATKNGRAAKFESICESYRAEQKQQAKSTQDMEAIHINHLTRILTPTTSLSSISLDRLKFYCKKRSGERHRGKLICSTTIRKELATFRRVWAWAEQNGHISGVCPLIGASGRWQLKLPKPKEKVKFQTRKQIERRIERGGLSEEEVRDLWKGLYLDEDQIAQVLSHVRENALHEFIYPMFAFAAYTGARRSEILRVQLDDIDFETNQVMIRERKRRKHLSTSTRFVPLHPELRRIMDEWYAIHPGGRYAFVNCKKTKCGRRHSETRKLTPHQATHHFKQSLIGSIHSVVVGFHVFRHSFGSNLVRTEKVPPHVVAQWMGHTTEEMQQLYQHLFPQDGLALISVLR